MSAPTILIRCDGSPQMGMGHVVRDLALAGAFRERGARVVFAMRPLDPAATAAALRSGVAVREVPYDGADHLGALGAQDRDATLAIAAEERAAAIVVDHYGAGGAYLEALAGFAPLAVVDELGDRRLDACALVVNQNLGADAIPYASLAPRARIAAGPQYAMLRPEFARARAAPRRAGTPATPRVLVTFGGGATSGLAARAVAALPREAALEVDVVTADEPAEPLRAAAAARGGVTLHHRPPAMSSLMAAADVALSAGGSTTWELCALAVPMVLVVLAENQRPSSRALASRGCAAVYELDALDEAARRAAALAGDPATCAAMARRAGELVDGRGAERVAEAVLRIALR